MAYTVNTSAAALNRAFNNANATPTAFAATAAALTADQIAAANTFDDASLTDLALSTKVLTNMGILPSTVAEVVALEAALADYFAGPGKGNRGFVVLQLAEILSGFAATDVFYGAAAAAWNAELTASVADSAPGTFALTTSTTDNLVGGSADDIFTAISTALASANTLSATDKITGGAGNDTLNIDLSTANAAFTTGSVTGVENVVVTNGSENSLAFNALGYTGVTAYTFNMASAPVTVTNLGTGVTTINLNNQGKSAGATASTTFSTTFASGAAELTGTTDAIALNLNAVGASATKLASVSIGSIETANVALTGANFAKLTSTDLKKVVVTGSGSNNFSTVPTSLTSFDASAATGAITVDLSSSTSTITKVALGSGNDTVTYEEQDGSAVATLTGGAGTDKLTLKSNGGTIELTQTGFETLALTTVSSALTLSGAKTADVATISTTSATDAPVTFVNMGAGALTFNSLGETDDVDHSSDHTGATTLNYKVVDGDATGADAPLSDYSFSGSTGALTVNVEAYVDASGSDVTAAKASSVALNVASGKSAADAELTIFNNTITAAVATSFTVDAAGSLGTVDVNSGDAAKISAAKATAGTITNGANAGELILVTPLLKTLTVTSGAALDLDTTDTNLSTLETLTVAANKGLTDFGALAKIANVTASGSGTTAALDLGNLGGNNAYNMSVTASGLKGGFTAGTVDVAVGYDVSITATGATGAVTVGHIGSNYAGDDVTVNAAGAGGAVAIGNVTASGDVTVDASGATGRATIGDISGDNVTAKVAGSAATSSIGTITAKTSATLTYSVVDAATVSVTAKTGSTALAVSATTGVLDDSLTITGISTQTGVTVTGDLGAGTDTLTVNSSASSADQTVSVSGLTSYSTSSLTTGGGDDTITGGAGVDTIVAGAGQDTITGGAGADKFVFNTGDSNYDAVDTITDLGVTDIITWGNGTTTVAANADGSASAATITSGIATFDLTTTATSKDTLYEVVGLVDASTASGKSVMFSFGGSTYFFIDTSTDNDIVVKLTGVVIPTVTLAADSGSTGITGFGAA